MSKNIGRGRDSKSKGQFGWFRWWMGPLGLFVGGLAFIAWIGNPQPQQPKPELPDQLLPKPAPVQVPKPAPQAPQSQRPAQPAVQASQFQIPPELEAQHLAAVTAYNAGKFPQVFERTKELRPTFEKLLAQHPEVLALRQRTANIIFIEAVSLSRLGKGGAQESFEEVLAKYGQDLDAVMKAQVLAEQGKDFFDHRDDKSHDRMADLDKALASFEKARKELDNATGDIPVRLKFSILNTACEAAYKAQKWQTLQAGAKRLREFIEDPKNNLKAAFESNVLFYEAVAWSRLDQGGDTAQKKFKDILTNHRQGMPLGALVQTLHEQAWDLLEHCPSEDNLQARWAVLEEAVKVLEEAKGKIRGGEFPELRVMIRSNLALAHSRFASGKTRYLLFAKDGLARAQAAFQNDQNDEAAAAAIVDFQTAVTTIEAHVKEAKSLYNELKDMTDEVYGPLSPEKRKLFDDLAILADALKEDAKPYTDEIKKIDDANKK